VGCVQEYTDDGKLDLCSDRFDQDERLSASRLSD